MQFELTRDKRRLAWYDKMKKMGMCSRDWQNEDTWYKGAKLKVNIRLSSHHDKRARKFFFRVIVKSETEDLLLDDLWIFKKNKFKDYDEELDFYDYLKALVKIALSDIRLKCDHLFMIGPAGLVNCKSNLEKVDIETYYIKHRWRKSNPKYMEFFHMVDELLGMDEIMEKAEHDVERVVFNIPFYDSSRLLPNRFGSYPYVECCRYRKYGSFVEDIKKLPPERLKQTTLYIPDKFTTKIFYLNTIRRTFLYKAMLDYFLEHGKEATLEHFTYNKIIETILRDPKFESAYCLETDDPTNEDDNNDSNNVGGKTLKDLTDGLKESAEYNVIDKVLDSNKKEYYIRKWDDDSGWSVDPKYAKKDDEPVRPHVQLFKSRDEYFGYVQAWTRFRDATYKKLLSLQEALTKVVAPNKQENVIESTKSVSPVMSKEAMKANREMIYSPYMTGPLVRSLKEYFNPIKKRIKDVLEEIRHTKFVKSVFGDSILEGQLMSIP